MTATDMTPAIPAAIHGRESRRDEGGGGGGAWCGGSLRVLAAAGAGSASARVGSSAGPVFLTFSVDGSGAPAVSDVGVVTRSPPPPPPLPPSPAPPPPP